MKHVNKIFLTSALAVLTMGGAQLAQAQRTPYPIYNRPATMALMTNSQPGDVGPFDAPQYGNLTGINVTKVALEYLGGVALDSGGNVYTWGWNGQGQLGIGMPDIFGSCPQPANVNTALIRAELFNCRAYAGGYQLVDFFTHPEKYAVQYARLKMAPELTQPTKIVDIGAGYHHVVALDEQGRVWAWGYNVAQQIGKTGIGTAGWSSNSSASFNFPQLVQGLPSNIAKVWGNNGYLDRGQSFALTSDGQLWSWGANGAIGKHGVGTTTATAAYQATPHQVVFPAGTVIVDVQGGDYHNIALDSNGNVWSWGYSYIGDGTTAKYQRTPVMLPPPPGMAAGTKITAISNSYDNSLMLDSNGEVWQWGYLFIGPCSGCGTVVKTPQKVQFEPAEIARVGYTPIPTQIAAGESVSYIVDQYGRSWAWGDGRYFGFGREGGYIDNSSIITTKAYQYPQVVGDGDTQIYDSRLKTPADGLLQKNQLNGVRYGTYGFNSLHPTIYDDKYIGATGAVAAWKNLAFKPIPKIRQMIGSRSAYIILDYHGNIFKWALDGSGTIAWGNGDYFDSRYDFTGNGRDGTFDKYCYEVVLMRSDGPVPPPPPPPPPPKQ